MSARVVVVDDHELLAQSLCFALVARGLDARPLPLTDRAALVDSVRVEAPDVVLLDLQLGGAIGSGLTLVGPCAAAGARVLVVSGVTDEAAIGRALEAGAVGYVCKSEPFEVLLDAAEQVAHGVPVLTAQRREVLLAAARRHRAEEEAGRSLHASLTPREREVLHALCEGDCVATIATRSFVSVPTVRTQVRAILLKLGVTSQLEAVAVAHRHRWYDGEPNSLRSA